MLMRMGRERGGPVYQLPLAEPRVREAVVEDGRRRGRLGGDRLRPLEPRVVEGGSARALPLGVLRFTGRTRPARVSLRVHRMSPLSRTGMRTPVRAFIRPSREDERACAGGRP